MARERKTIDVFELWSNYGHGWEVETEEATRFDAQEQRKCYRENTNGSFKIKKKRVLKSTLTDDELATHYRTVKESNDRRVKARMMGQVRLAAIFG